MRIASLLPSATEILFAIGAGPEVVGVTHECDHPAAALSLPKLTANAIDHDGQASRAIDRHIHRAVHEGSAIYYLDEAELTRLKPDLVVTQELCEVCAVSYQEVARAARRLPGAVPVLSLEPMGLDDILATILTTGRATGRLEQAEALVSELRSRIEAVAALTPPSGFAPSVVCIEWTDPLMAGGHWVPEMVRLAGGRDALGAEHQPSQYVEWQAVLDADPDVMVLMPCGYDLDQTLERAAEVTARPGFENLSCAREGRVVAVDGSGYFNRPGPRIADGLEILAATVRARPSDGLPAGAAWVPVSR